MILLQINEMKKFMMKLLLENTFDDFFLSEGTVMTFCEFSFYGRKNKAFDEPKELKEPSALEEQNHTGSAAEGEALEELTPWARIKPYVFQVIKGNKTPTAFSFVFVLPREKQRLLDLPEQVLLSLDKKTKFLQNIRFDHGICKITTAVSYGSFTMDKTPEHAWDAWLQRFYKEAGIEFVNE